MGESLDVRAHWRRRDGSRLRLIGAERLMRADGPGGVYVRVRGVRSLRAAEKYAASHGYVRRFRVGMIALDRPITRVTMEAKPRAWSDRPRAPASEVDPDRAARLDRYAIRRVFRLPLFEGCTPAAKDDEGRPRCWCCGRAPDAAKSEPQTHLHTAGWAVREVRFGVVNARELYCPECFAEWGWPEEYDGR